MKHVTSKFATFCNMPKYAHNIITMQSLKNYFLIKKDLSSDLLLHNTSDWELLH
jgi:hypothetical protein